ncbi:hypothetical protein COLO4_15906 [Corchorus olitorius]|uniref:Uncharacterized protein n=1 Tax=Corchorus olitorius TaxID=93759 RepID=A0A1R3JKR6_9ROSI|nr:hypothetical protein COLO4_15906 [Corchorus olitorius]
MAPLPSKTMFEIEVEESVSAEKVDLLDKFLPPPPKAKCSRGSSS